MRYALTVAGLAAAAQAGVHTLTETVDVTITSCAPTVTNCPYKSQTWAAWDPQTPDATTTPAAASWSAWESSKPVDPASTWAAWDPSKPADAASTWAAWDPSKPADAASTWAAWDPSKPVGAASTWAAWDSSKPSTTSKPVDAASTWAAWSSVSATPASTGAACPQYSATAPPAWFSQLPSDVLSSMAAQWTGAPPSNWCYYSYSAAVVTQTKTPVAATGAAQSTWAAWQGTGTPVQGVNATGTGSITKYTGAANANAASFVLAGAAAVAAVVLA